MMPEFSRDHSHNLTGCEVQWVPCVSLTHCPSVCDHASGEACAQPINEPDTSQPELCPCCGHSPCPL